MIRVFFLVLIFNAIYSQAQLVPEVVYTSGHNTQINGMVVSNDNKFLASAGNNKLVKIWEVSSGREFRTITGSDGRINVLFFAPDNRTLIGISTEHEMIGWDIITGAKLFETPANGNFKLGYDFHKDGQKIIYVTENNQLARFDLKSKTIEVVDEKVYCMGLVLDNAKERIYAFSFEETLRIYDINNFQLIGEMSLKGQKPNQMIQPCLTNDGRFIINVLSNNALRIIDVTQKKIIFNANVGNGIINNFTLDRKRSQIYISYTTGRVVIYDYQKNKMIDTFDAKETFPLNGMTTYPSGDVLIMSNFNLIRFYNIKTKQFFKRLEPKILPIINMSYDQKGKYLAVARTRGTVEIWDLRLNKIVRELHGLFPCQFSPDGSKLVCMNSTLDFVEYNADTWEQVGKYKTNYSLFQRLAFSKNGRYLAMGGFVPEVKLFDTKSKMQVKTLKGQMGVSSMDFHPIKPQIVISASDNTCKVWDYLTEKEIHQFTEQPFMISGAKYSPDGKIIGTTSWDKTIVLHDAANFKMLKKWSGHHGNIDGLDFNASGEVLMTYATNTGVYEADNSVIFWKLDGTKISEIEAHTSGVTKAFFDKKADYVFSASDDGSIKINDFKQNKVLATYLATSANEFIIYTPENYYMASKKALRAIAFRLGSDLVPFEQFDINLNRPDIIAKSIGKSPDQLIRAYEYLYKKRLRKFNLDEGSIKLDFSLPNVKIENDLPLVTSESSVILTIKSWDEQFTINQVNVYVNDTPIYGEQGLRPSSKVNTHRQTITIPIIKGINKIQVSCINSNGTESYYDTKQVVKDVKGNEKKQDLYFVAIGVSKYNDSRFDLTYPSKDARDMVEKLGQANNIYSEIHTKIILDDQVSRSSFMALKDFFKTCKPDDIAAIFIAGHGLLDENFDYFFGTHDVDFDHPSINGLPYSEIHILLNTIKAYRKLLIMDTCHSGELDKEEVENRVDAELEEGDIQFRSAGSTVKLKDAFGFENSLKLTQDLFSDTRKGSGATVISSAGGAEYAMESAEWNNGLFTYAFLSGLTANAADLNKDGFVQISEIRTYVNRKVSKLSKGKQLPSSREENISADFSIY